MNIRKLLLLVFLTIPLAAVAFAQGANTPSDWELVGKGIEFQQYHLTSPAPTNIFVARLERNNPEVTIESSIAQGKLSGGAETVSGMAERYDQALNFWGAPTIPVSQTWGSRNDVIVAINGFYYGSPWEDSGVPWSGQIHSGWYAKRYYEQESLSGFVWKNDRSTFIGECITHPLDKQVVYIANGENHYTHYLDGINITRAVDELILYTPQYDSDTNTKAVPEGIEVLIEMEVPTSISVASDMPHGIIREIRDKKGSTPIPFDHVVLSAHGTAAIELRANANVGSPVAIAQRVKDCTNFPTHDWNYAYAGVGGQFYFLRDGVIFDYSDDGQANVRDPRTAIAYSGEYIYFIVVDGRDPGVSEGMTVAELADFVKDTLGATDAIMQDGGGSSTMVINNQVVNNTFCNNYFCTDKVFLPLIVNSTDEKAASDHQNQPVEPFIGRWSKVQASERLVANGMMMVVVEPIEQSKEPYDPNDPISTIGTVDVYLGPGNNYAVFSTANGNGSISSPINMLGGVYAKGSYWWKINIGNVQGWVIEADITPLLKYRSSYEFKAR